MLCSQILDPRPFRLVVSTVWCGEFEFAVENSMASLHRLWSRCVHEVSGLHAHGSNGIHMKANRIVNMDRVHIKHMVDRKPAIGKRGKPSLATIAWTVEIAICGTKCTHAIMCNVRFYLDGWFLLHNIIHRDRVPVSRNP